MKKRFLSLIQVLFFLVFAASAVAYDVSEYTPRRRRYVIRYRPTYPQYRNLRIGGGILMTYDYTFLNFQVNYDYFDGNRSIYHLVAGFTPRDTSSGSDTTGFTAGFIYGRVMSKSHYRDGATVLSLDFGGYVNMMDIDGIEDYGSDRITGKYNNYEFCFGPRFDLYLKFFGSKKSLMDMWFSTYLHVLGGYKEWDRYENGSLDNAEDGGGVGILWGMVLTASMINLELEGGYLNEGFLRFSFGISFNL